MRMQKKMAISRPRKEASKETNPVHTLTLDGLPASRTVRKKIPVHHPVWVLFTAAQVNECTFTHDHIPKPGQPRSLFKLHPFCDLTLYPLYLGFSNYLWPRSPSLQIYLYLFADLHFFLSYKHGIIGKLE